MGLLKSQASSTWTLTIPDDVDAPQVDGRQKPEFLQTDTKHDQGRLRPSSAMEHFNDQEKPATPDEPTITAEATTSPEATIPAEAVIFKEVIEFKEAQTRSAGLDPWDFDPANPRNWSHKRKWRSTAIVAFYTSIAPLASTMMAPGLPEIADHFRITSPTVVALTLSIYVLAFVFGPLFTGPLSEIYGRRWILHYSNFFFGVFCLGQIFAPTATALIVFRFLSGIGGSAPVSIGGACIGDMFSPAERAAAMSIYTLGALLGPIVGPIIGGFVVQEIGFKYVFVLLAALAGIGALLGIPFLDETYAPVIKARLAKLLVNDLEASWNPAQFFSPRPSVTDVLHVNLSRPFLLITRSFICFSLSLIMALTYGFLYVMYTTFPTLFSGIYGWSPGVTGLAYLGPGVGLLLSTIVGAPLMNRTYSRLCERNGGVGKPEFRIPTMLIGSALIPIGLFWYGWSAQSRSHWIMPVIGSSIFSFGMMFIYIPIQLYLVDAFTYAASALAAAAVLRAMFGFAFPLFGEQTFAKLGFGGGNSLFAGLTIVIGIPIPIWIYYHGERLRARNPLNR